jgi:hypothetical protein
VFPEVDDDRLSFTAAVHNVLNALHHSPPFRRPNADCASSREFSTSWRPTTLASPAVAPFSAAGCMPRLGGPKLSSVNRAALLPGGYARVRAGSGAAGAPRKSPSVLRSSSTSGQWIANQRRRSASFDAVPG